MWRRTLVYAKFLIQCTHLHIPSDSFEVSNMCMNDLRYYFGHQMLDKKYGLDEGLRLKFLRDCDRKETLVFRVLAWYTNWVKGSRMIVIPQKAITELKESGILEKLLLKSTVLKMSCSSGVIARATY